MSQKFSFTARGKTKEGNSYRLHGVVTATDAFNATNAAIAACKDSCGLVPNAVNLRMLKGKGKR